MKDYEFITADDFAFSIDNFSTYSGHDRQVLAKHMNDILNERAMKSAAVLVGNPYDCFSFMRSIEEEKCAHYDGSWVTMYDYCPKCGKEL